MKLRYEGWGSLSDPRCPSTQVHLWSDVAVAKYAEWVAERGLVLFPTIQARIDQQKVSKPVRGKTESLRAFRLRARKWEVKKFGSLSKLRAACKLEKVKQQRWQILMDQGLPLKDPEAIIWWMRRRMFKSPVWGGGYQTWFPDSEAAKIAGGSLPPGIAFNRQYDAEMSDVQKKMALRAAASPKAQQHVSLKDKYYRETLTAAKAAYRNAKFRTRYSESLEIGFYRSDDLAGKPDLVMTHTQPEAMCRRRRRHDTTAALTLPSSWYRRVYKTKLANAFGERTLVLDTYLTADKQRTMIVLARQGARLYKVEVVRGYLARNIDGTPKFMED